jgi:hypothetical protein
MGILPMSTTGASACESRAGTALILMGETPMLLAGADARTVSGVSPWRQIADRVRF